MSGSESESHDWAGVWTDVFGSVPTALHPEPVPEPLSKVPKMTSTQIIDLLTRFYVGRNVPGMEAWVVFPELIEGIHYHLNGRIDLYAMSIWTTKGMERISYEVKISRSDYFHELKQPEKREYALRVSHRYYFATPPGLIKKDELPPEAGLVEVYPDGKVHFKHRAPRRECPDALTTQFAASIMRRAFRVMLAGEGIANARQMRGLQVDLQSVGQFLAILAQMLPREYEHWREDALTYAGKITDVMAVLRSPSAASSDSRTGE